MRDTMRICRKINGKLYKFELTKSELETAYHYQRLLWDINFVKTRFTNDEHDEFYKVLDLDEGNRELAFSDIAYSMRELLNDGDNNYTDEEAFYMAFDEYITENNGG